MPIVDLKPKSQPDIDQLNAILSLRWLVVILACYLTLFSYLGTDLFPFVSAVALAFALSNIGLMLVPRHQFTKRGVQWTLSSLDVVFISMILYLLRVPDNYLYLGFIGIFVLAIL